MIIDEEPSLPELEGYLSPETIPNLYLIYDARRELGKRARFRAAVGPGGVEGVSLLYRGNPYTSVWILGTERAAEGLLEGEPVQRVIVCTQPPLAGLVESRLPGHRRYEVDVMAARRPLTARLPTGGVRRLSADDAYQWATLRADPADGGPSAKEVEEAAKLLQENVAFGLYEDGSLVSRALSHVRMPEGWGVSGVFTRQDRRGRGYASSVVSALAEAAFRETDSVMLFVRSDNAAAKSAYQKVGFSTVANRVFCDVGVGWSP